MINIVAVYLFEEDDGVTKIVWAPFGDADLVTAQRNMKWRNVFFFPCFYNGRHSNRCVCYKIGIKHKIFNGAVFSNINLIVEIGVSEKSNIRSKRKIKGVVLILKT